MAIESRGEGGLPPSPLFCWKERVIEYPLLRPLEPIPLDDGRVCLRDPEGIAEQLVVVPAPLLHLLVLFDGSRAVPDLQEELHRLHGETPSVEKLREIIEQLDRCLLLESPRSQEARRAALAAFRAAPAREATHAGSAYEGGPAALRAQLDGYFLGPDGPGAGPSGAGDGAAPRALVAPHIDPRRGGACYAWSYGELARGAAARTFVVLGISHAPTRHRFVLTAKDFATPLGLMRTDRDFVSRLAARLETDFFDDELAHRGEHSIEFQILFLQRLLERVRPDGPVPRLVPILCSSLPPEPEADAEVRAFLPALKELVDERGEEACLIAAVDLSHVGKRFGQDVRMTDALLKGLERNDRGLLERVEERDAEGFHRRIVAQQDGTNVCGVPALYALLRLLGPGPRGRLLRYDQAVDREAHSVVSFAAAVFRG